MEARIKSVIVFAGLGLFVCLVLYGVLPLESRCNSLYCPGRLQVEPSVISTNESKTLSSCTKHSGGDCPEKSIAQFLKEKVDKGLSRDEERNELAGLDFASRALLEEVVQAMTKPEAEANQKEWKLLNFNYGVTRVVWRLVVCSAYRTSLREFTVITLSPDFTIPTSNPDFAMLPPKDPAVKRTCTWLADGMAGAPHFGSTQEMDETGRSAVGNGVVKFQWISELHGTSYDVLLIHCSFPEAVGTDLTGGFLYLNITHGFGDSAPTELAPVFYEQPKTLNASLYELSPRKNYKFQYKFAYCSAPVFTPLTPEHVKQFLMYHYALLGGSVHFFIYDSLGIDDKTMAVLQPLIDAGSLTVVDFRKESQYDTWYHSQVLAINDCLYRTRVLADWVLFLDLDEYLHVRPPLTLQALLEQNKYVPWITFGKFDFTLNHCAPRSNRSGTEWAVERMLYREQRPICGEFCNGPQGARKWMANPRKVSAGRIHSIANQYARDGLVLSTRVAALYHYRGLVAPRGRFNCQQIHDSNSTTIVDGSTRLDRDFELASIVGSTLKSSAEALEMFAGSGS